MLASGGSLHRFQVEADFIDLLDEGSRGGSRHQNLVAHMQIHILYQELGNANLGEVLHALAHIDLHFRCLRTIDLAPFTQTLALIVAIPEAAVEHGGELFVPSVQACLILMETAIEHCLDGFVVGRHHCLHILGTTRTSFNLEYAHACVHHHIHEANRFQVLGRHDVLVIHLKLCACLDVLHLVAAPTNLHAFTTVGRASRILKTEIALATDGHAKGSMAEHLDAHQLSRRTLDLLLHNLVVDVLHLPHIQFSCQHDHIGKLSIEFQRLHIRDVQLCAEVHLLSHLLAIHHHCHVASNHGRNPGFLGCIHYLVHGVDVLAIDDGVDGEIALQSRLLADGSDVLQVVDAKGTGGMRAHIELSDAEIHGIGSGMDGCRQTFSRPHRSHDFKIFTFHASLLFEFGCKITNLFTKI